jgi:hypothetical protein
MKSFCHFVDHYWISYDNCDLYHLLNLIQNIGETCAASGFKLDVDLALANAVKQQANGNGINDTDEV